MNTSEISYLFSDPYILTFIILTEVKILRVYRNLVTVANKLKIQCLVSRVNHV